MSTDHVPDRLAVDKRLIGAELRPDQQWRRRASRRLLAVVYSEGVQRGRISVERMVDLLSTTPARLFGLNTRARSRWARTPTLSCSIRRSGARSPKRELHHTSDFTPYEGMAASGLVSSVLVRGEFVIRDGHFVGRRGFGQFQERRLTWR